MYLDKLTMQVENLAKKFGFNNVEVIDASSISNKRIEKCQYGANDFRIVSLDNNISFTKHDFKTDHLQSRIIDGNTDALVIIEKLKSGKYSTSTTSATKERLKGESVFREGQWFTNITKWSNFSSELTNTCNIINAEIECENNKKTSENVEAMSKANFGKRPGITDVTKWD